MNKIIQMKDADGNLMYPIGYAQGGMKMDLLWTNPNPDTNIQDNATFEIDLSNYDLFIVISNAGTGSSISRQIYNTKLVTKNVKTNIEIIETYMSTRSITLQDNQMIVGTGSWVHPNGTINDDYIRLPIIQKIYGIKLSYIVPTEVHGLQYTEDN